MATIYNLDIKAFINSVPDSQRGVYAVFRKESEFITKLKAERTDFFPGADFYPRSKNLILIPYQKDPEEFQIIKTYLRIRGDLTEINRAQNLETLRAPSDVCFIYAPSWLELAKQHVCA